MPLMLDANVSQAADEIKKNVADMGGYEPALNDVLVGIYTRSDRTAGGIILAESTRKEDQHQGKVGIVLKLGPQAFKDSDNFKFEGQKVNIGDWVVFKASDAWPVTLGTRDGLCRQLPDTAIRGTISQPDQVF